MPRIKLTPEVVEQLSAPDPSGKQVMLIAYDEAITEGRNLIKQIEREQRRIQMRGCEPS